MTGKLFFVALKKLAGTQDLIGSKESKQRIRNERYLVSIAFLIEVVVFGIFRYVMRNFEHALLIISD